jgi:hypothetical protein
MVHCDDDSKGRAGDAQPSSRRRALDAADPGRAAAFVKAAHANGGRATLPLSDETPARFVHEPDARLLFVLFHGAVDRAKTTLPVFRSPLPLPFPAHQLSVFDSALFRSGAHSLGWYAGHE